MIRPIAQCPYCDSEVAVNDDPPGLVFHPHRAQGKPCRHLATLLATLDAYTVELDGDRVYSPEHSGVWMWEHGQALRLQHVPQGQLPQDQPLTGLIMDLADDILKPSERRRLRRIAHEVCGGSAEQREQAILGTGCYRYITAGRAIYAELSGWAVYSPTPARLAAAMRAIVS